MKIYIDLIFFLNFTFDFILLLTVSLILKRNVKIKRLLLGALIGSSSLFFLFLPMTNITLFIFKVVISVFMILGTFGFKNKSYFFKNFTYLYLISIILGGFLYFLNIQFSYKNEGLVFFYKGLSINVIFLIVVSPFILYFYVKEMKKLKFHRETNHTVDIYLSSKSKITLDGYLDTGNQLYDPYHHRPILLVSSNLLEIPYEKAIVVPYQTLEGSGVLKCRKVKKVVIDQSLEFSNVLVAKSTKNFNLGSAEVIIHPDFFK